MRPPAWAVDALDGVATLRSEVGSAGGLHRAPGVGIGEGGALGLLGDVGAVEHDLDAPIPQLRPHGGDLVEVADDAGAAGGGAEEEDAGVGVGGVEAVERREGLEEDADVLAAGEVPAVGRGAVGALFGMFRVFATLSVFAVATPAFAGMYVDTSSPAPSSSTTSSSSTWSTTSSGSYSSDEMDVFEILYGSTADDMCSLQGSYWCNSYDSYAFSPYGRPSGYYYPYYQNGYVDPYSSWGNSYDPFMYSPYGYVGYNY